MARVTVSVPDELRDQMEAFEGINWSAAAQAAFRREIMMAEARNKGGDVEAGLARLRASRDANGDALFAEGVGLGKVCALQFAEADQVERIAALHAQEGGFADGEAWGDSWLVYLVAAWLGVESSEVGNFQPQEFAERFLNRDCSPPDALVRGFVQGVAEIHAML